MSILHEPVMLPEVMEHLDPRPGDVFVDATLGSGGHTKALLERTAPSGRVLGVDADPEAIARARHRLGELAARLIACHATFDQVPRLVAEHDVGPIAGIVVDLGVSTEQLKTARRGFSFRDAGPLDMRMDPTRGMPASSLLRTIDLEELVRILYEGGQERFTYRVAKAILAAVEQGEMERTDQLAAVVSGAIPRRFWPRRVHPATVVFQALRIAVNGELDRLEASLEGMARILAPGGRLVVLAYHSGEDRIVKRLFRRLCEEAFCGPRRSAMASPEEVSLNPRARSVRLRWIEREGDRGAD